MLVPGQAANADRFFPFLITAAAGVNEVNTSRVTSELWTPYIQFEGFHNDPVARHLRLILVGTSAGGVELGLTLQSSETDYPGVPIGTNIAYTLRRLIWVPPNFFLRVQAPGLAALQTVSLAGATAQINLAEPSPPLFA